MSSRLFWGLVVMVIGVSIVVQVLFKIQFPIWRLVVGAVLIFWGIQFVTYKGQRTQGGAEGVFSEGVYEAKNLNRRSFSYIFSSQTVDLRHVAFGAGTEISVEAIFASVEVLLPENVHVELDSEAIFAKVDSRAVRTGPSVDSINVRIKAEAIFANIEIRQ